eukprot:Protomagalhaensia_sp_Gyna_25__2454@NODE_236_length_4233_cov_278_907725_g183_i0_p1_GENE_NODE_236_length_4233_cov_278_907725_g183_i0NODE_236_length_4233_cov_278_907725_g183_i0_p1_ORF_typecomplete_len321_score42_14UCH/PF00443_29/1_8e15_NODE_236_length_4233_cov_278_907725_g183_i017012663
MSSSLAVPLRPSMGMVQPEQYHRLRPEDLNTRQIRWDWPPYKVSYTIRSTPVTTYTPAHSPQQRQSPPQEVSRTAPFETSYTTVFRTQAPQLQQPPPQLRRYESVAKDHWGLGSASFSGVPSTPIATPVSSYQRLSSTDDYRGRGPGTRLTPAAGLVYNSRLISVSHGSGYSPTSVSAPPPPLFALTKPDLSPSRLRTGSKKSRTSPPPQRKLLGLQNYGNTCYCNVVLQGLLSCQEFCEYWLSKKAWRGNPASEYKSDLLRAWIEFLQENFEEPGVSEKENVRRPSLATQQKKLLTLIRHHNPQFLPDTQADAHDCLLA